MSRKVNLKAVGILMVVTAVLGAGFYFLRGFQIRRNARIFLAQADKARENKELAQELRYLHTYLSLVPTDIDVRARRAEAVHTLAKSRPELEFAFDLLEGVLRVAPERKELRRKLIDTAGKLGRPRDALYHLEWLYNEDGVRDVSILEAMGDNQVLMGKLAKAAERYRQAIEYDPRRISSYASLARVLRRDPELAIDEDEDPIQEMLEANPDSPEAQVARAKDLRERPGTEAAKREEVRKALRGLVDRHAASLPELLLVAAAMELDAGETDGARKLLERGLAEHPKEYAFYLDLARLELRAGRREKVLAWLKRADEQKVPCTDYPGTIGVLLEAKEEAEAKKLVERVGRDEDGGSFRDYLDGRVEMAGGRWVKAIRHLDRASKSRWLLPEGRQSIELLLSQAHRQLGNHDLALEAATRSLENNPGWVPGLLARADALAALGKTEEALQVYEGLQTTYPDARLAAVALRLDETLRKPAASRRWDGLQESLDRAPEETRAGVRWAALSAQLLLAQGKAAAAVPLLERACKQHPTDVSLWLLLTDAVDDGKGGAKVVDVLARAERAAPGRFEIALARARAAERGGEEGAVKRFVTDAEKTIEGRPAAEKEAWLRGLAAFNQRFGERGAATRLYTSLGKLKPDDLDVQRALFDLALADGDTERLKKIVDALKSDNLEGKDGATGLLGEAVLLATPGTPEEGVTDEEWREDVQKRRTKAKESLKELQKRRPGWGRLDLLKAQIAEAEGHTEQAVAGYKAALEHGEVRPEVVTRLVRLLAAQRNDDEVLKVLDRYRELIPSSGELTRQEALRSLRAGGGEQYEAALKSLPEASKDFRTQLVRGQILWAAKKYDDAEKALRKAAELGEKQPEVYLTLVSFLKEREKGDVGKEIEAAKERLPAEVAALTVAACYEILGQRERADTLYKAVLTDRPNDPAVLRAVGEWFLRRGLRAQAEPLFLKLIKITEGVNPGLRAWARRTLAMSLATGNYAEYRQALELLDMNAKEGGSADDQRTRALIQARQPLDRREAIRNLEEAFVRVRPSPPEEFLLVTLLVANGEWPKARERMIRLLTSRDGGNPVFLVYHLDQLIERGEADQADPWLAELEKAEPGSLRTVGIKAKLLRARGKAADGRDLLTRYAEKHAKEPQLVLGAARVMESLEFFDDAERGYRAAAAALREKQPQALAPLIGFLGRRKKVREALDLCNEVKDKLPGRVLAELAVGVLRDGQPTAEESRRVVGWMQEAKKKGADGGIYDLALANISDLLGDRAGALGVYRTLIEKDAKNVLAHNNLAILLALSERKFDEARSTIDKAIALAGPQPELLDSQGIVLLAADQPREAIRALEQATQMVPDPASFFRLAIAYWKVGEQRLAREAWRKAQSGGFTLEKLHPLEQPAADGAFKALSTTPG